MYICFWVLNGHSMAIPGAWFAYRVAVAIGTIGEGCSIMIPCLSTRPINDEALILGIKYHLLDPEQFDDGRRFF